jgi:hypothetical protein
VNNDKGFMPEYILLLMKQVYHSGGRGMFGEETYICRISESLDIKSNGRNGKSSDQFLKIFSRNRDLQSKENVEVV